MGGRRPDFIELWEWILVPGEEDVGRPHPPGIRELIHVSTGTLTLVVDEEETVVETGGSAAYGADQPHSYRNDGSDPLTLVLVMVDPTGSASAGLRG